MLLSRSQLVVYGCGLNGAAVLVVGVAYKKNSDDNRESPALTMMGLLEDRGGRR